MDNLNANEAIALEDLALIGDQQGEVKGGPFTGALTLGSDSTIGANAAPGATVTWTYKVLNRGSVD